MGSLAETGAAEHIAVILRRITNKTCFDPNIWRKFGHNVYFKFTQVHVGIVRYGCDTLSLRRRTKGTIHARALSSLDP